MKSFILIAIFITGCAIKPAIIHTTPSDDEKFFTEDYKFIIDNAKQLVIKGEVKNFTGNEKGVDLEYIEQNKYRGYSSKFCYIAHRGGIITPQQGEECLEKDVNVIYTQIRQLLPHLHSNHYAALIDLVYMVGLEGFKKSNLFLYLEIYQDKLDASIIPSIREEWVVNGWNKFEGKYSKWQQQRMQRQFDMFVKN